MTVRAAPDLEHDVVRTAVALAYGAGDDAPRVAARGHGALADEIIRRAREAGIFVHESRELVALLARVDIDQRIPPALYVAIAELLAWIHRLDRGTGGDESRKSLQLPAPIEPAAVNRRSQTS